MTMIVQIRTDDVVLECGSGDAAVVCADRCAAGVEHADGGVE